jgi:2-oxoglutarate ferredoxin oxidoreductase subunit beta
VVQLGSGITESDLLVHDERGPYAYTAMLCAMQPPEFPSPIGVLRRIEAPRFDHDLRRQIATLTESKGRGDLAKAIHSANTWEVR